MNQIPYNFAVFIKLIAFTFFFTCPKLGFSYPITIISQTQINAHCQIAGKESILKGRITDDLKQGIGNANISVLITSINPHESQKKSLETSVSSNKFGDFEVPLPLEDDVYHIELKLIKTKELLPSRKTINCPLSKLPLQLRWNLEPTQLHAQGSALQLVFQYQSKLTKTNPALRLSLPGLDLQELQLDNATNAHYHKLNTKALKPGLYPLTATILENDVFQSQSLSSNILILGNVKINARVVEQNALSSALEGEIRSQVKDLPPLSIKIQIQSPLHKREREILIESNIGGTFSTKLDLKGLASGHYNVTLSLPQTDSKEAREKITFYHEAPQLPLAIILALLSILLVFTLLALGKHFRVKLAKKTPPPNPYQVFAYQKKEIPQDYRKEDMAYLIFCTNSRNIGLEARLKFFHNEQVLAQAVCNKEGYYLVPKFEKNNLTLRLSLETFLDLKIAFPPPHISAPACLHIQMRSIREYAIESFNYLSKRYFPLQNLWGFKTPRELCKALEKHFEKSKNLDKEKLKSSIQRLRQLFEDLSFDPQAQDTIKAEEIYEIIQFLAQK